MDWFVNVVTVVAAVFACGYLGFAMIRPEKF